MRTSKEYMFVYLKGIAMGAADLVPGVSGGTIALITDIYEELIARHISGVPGWSIEASCRLQRYQFCRGEPQAGDVKTRWQRFCSDVHEAHKRGISTSGLW